MYFDANPPKLSRSISGYLEMAAKGYALDFIEDYAAGLVYSE
jgi:hypothetical protein